MLMEDIFVASAAAKKKNQPKRRRQNFHLFDYYSIPVN
jgi:hypothetical protein